MLVLPLLVVKVKNRIDHRTKPSSHRSAGLGAKPIPRLAHSSNKVVAASRALLGVLPESASIQRSATVRSPSKEPDISRYFAIPHPKLYEPCRLPVRFAPGPVRTRKRVTHDRDVDAFARPLPVHQPDAARVNQNPEEPIAGY